MGFLSYNFISEFLVLLLKWFYTGLQDYSLCIILLTILIKTVLLPLDLKQRKSSRLMSNINEEVKAVQKRYANDPQHAQKKVQELYKERGVKPMAGCLPMILSMVLLFAFFGALRVIVSDQTVSIMLRAAHDGAGSVSLPSWLWIHNFYQPDSGLVSVLPSANEFLSFIRTNSVSITPQTLTMLQHQGLISYTNGVMSMDSNAVLVYNNLVGQIISANGMEGVNNGWFGLPVIAGISLFFQQKLMSKGMAQQPGGKLMLYIFPLFSVYICATSNGAFALYWVVSNLYSVATYLVTTAYYKHRDKKKPLTVKDIR